MSEQKDRYDTMPFGELIYIIGQNKGKYHQKEADVNLRPHGRFLKHIYYNKNLSQDDIAEYFHQTKGNVAKGLRKLEDEGYIERKVDPNNRRKYILNTTTKGDAIIPKMEKVNKKWEDAVGVNDLPPEMITKLQDIAKKSKDLIN